MKIISAILLELALDADAQLYNYAAKLIREALTIEKCEEIELISLTLSRE